MRKIALTFGLAALSMGVACKQNFAEDAYAVQLQAEEYSVENDPCIIEVPCKEGELNHLLSIERRGILEPKKYYDFCDSTVTITARGSIQSGPIYNVRSITDVKGRERAEKDSAYVLYQKRALKR